MQLLFRVPPLRGDATRLSALLSALEALLPGAELTWRAEGPAEVEASDAAIRAGGVRLVHVPDREGWVTKQVAAGQDVLLYSAPPRGGVSVGASAKTDVAVRSGDAMGEIIVYFAPGVVPWDQLPSVLAACGDALGAWWCTFTPLMAAGLLLQLQLAPAGRVSLGRQRLLERTPELARLPKLRGALDALPSVESPLSLGWLNYWSVATATWLGFPKPHEDAEWLTRSFQTPSGGWVLKLTDAPLELERREHVETLVRAYGRFERIAKDSE